MRFFAVGVRRGSHLVVVVDDATVVGDHEFRSVEELGRKTSAGVGAGHPCGHDVTVRWLSLHVHNTTARH